MLDVPNWVKNIYKYNSETKYIRIYFPDSDYEVPIENVYTESMTLSESILDDKNIQVVGCISTEFRITIRKDDALGDPKGQHIEAYIYTDSTEDYEIPLFHGSVENVTNVANTRSWELTCYDALYHLGDLDMMEFYNANVKPQLPKTYQWIREQFWIFIFAAIGVGQKENQTLPSDNVILRHGFKFDSNEYSALQFICDLCEINGRFGIIDRNNQFIYRAIDPINENFRDIEDVPFYKDFSWQDFTVYPFSAVTIRESADDPGGSYINPLIRTNSRYIVEGNVLVKGKTTPTLIEQAEELLMGANGVVGAGTIIYTPYSADCYAYPWVEPGDVLRFHAYDFDNSTGDDPQYIDVDALVFNRELTGIQSMMDHFEIDGEKEQRIFGSGEDTNTKITKNYKYLSEIKMEVGKTLDKDSWLTPTAAQKELYGDDLVALYDLSERYKDRTVVIKFNASKGSKAQRQAFKKAGLEGGEDGDFILCYKTKPTVNIPIIMKVT